MAIYLLPGLLGLFNGIIASPVPIVLGATHTENYSMLTATIVLWVIFKGFADNVLSDYLWAKSIQFTNPTIATVGKGVNTVHDACHCSSPLGFGLQVYR